jgi:L-fucose isomerase-like protein
MELLKYSKRGQTAPHCSFHQITEKWFGCQSFLQYEINKGFQDNSLAKESSKKIRIRRKYEKLKKDLIVVQENADKIRKLRQKIRLQANGFKMVKEMNDDSSQLCIKMNKAAVLIQKAVRGFLTRKTTAGV